MSLRRGIPEQNFNVNRACFPKETTPNFTKMGEIHELFVLALSLVWFAGATPDFNSSKTPFNVRLEKNLSRLCLLIF